MDIIDSQKVSRIPSAQLTDYEFIKRGDNPSFSNQFISSSGGIDQQHQFSNDLLTKKRTLSNDDTNQQLLTG